MPDLLDDTPVIQGSRVAVLDPNGEPVTIDVADLDGALKNGYQLESRAGHHERILEKRYGDSPITTALEGGARAATFGVSDLLLGAEEGGEGVAERRKRSPIAATVGEVGGMLTGAGAAGAIGKLGAGVAERVGGTALIEGLLGGGTLARAAGTGIKLGTGAATEGALYGAQQTVSQVALSEEPMNAEAIMGALGSNMVYGGLTAGATGGALGSLGSIAKAAAVRARNGMSRWADAAANEAAVPADLAHLDRAGLKAARAAEQEAAGVAQKAERTAINDDLVAYREQVRDALKDLPGALAKSGTAQKGLARELIQAERGLAGAIDTIPEAPTRGLTALRKLERATGNARTALGDELGAPLDDLLARNTALKTRLEATMKPAATERLAAIESRLEDLANPSLGAQLGDFAKDKMLGAVGGTLAGVLGGGPIVGAAVGFGLNALKKRLGASAAEFGTKLTAGVDRALTAVDAAAPELARKIALGTSFGAQAARRSDDDLEQRAHDVLDAVANIDASRNQVHEGLAGIRMVDVKLADQLEENAMRRLDYLATKAPKNPGMGALGGADRWRPNDQELNRFARVVAATEQPLRILDELAADRLTPDTVDAVKNVYPELFKRLGVEVLDKVLTVGKNMPRSRRLGLTMLLDTPVDSQFRPEFVARQQESWAKMRADAAERAKQQKPRPQSTGGGGSLSDAAPTQAQSRSL